MTRMLPLLVVNFRKLPIYEAPRLLIRHEFCVSIRFAHVACVGLVCVALSSHLRLWPWGHDSVKSAIVGVWSRVCVFQECSYLQRLSFGLVKSCEKSSTHFDSPSRASASQFMPYLRMSNLGKLLLSTSQ